MQLLKVDDERSVALFHEVPARIYGKDPNWIPHIYKEIENVFDRSTNGGFQNGDAIRWVLLDRNFEPVGRIAAFYNQKDTDDLMGGIGFYECREDWDYSKVLFDQAESWLTAQNVHGVDGPVNFGERHQFWGCQTFGEGVPIYQENYNPGYYKDQFLRQGYRPYFESLTYQVDLKDISFDWLDRMYGKIVKRGLRFASFCQDETDRFVDDYLAIARKTFELTNRTVKIDKDTIVQQLNIQKSVLREDLVWFAYQDDEPIGVLGFMLNWAGMLNAALQFGNEPPKQKSVKGFVVAIIPTYQQRGVLIGLLYHIGQALLADGTIDKIFICGVAGYSKGVHSVVRKFEAKTMARHVTFRKYFDRRKVTFCG